MSFRNRDRRREELDAFRDRLTEETEKKAENPMIAQFTSNSEVLVDVPGYGPVKVRVVTTVLPVVAMERGADYDAERRLPTTSEAHLAISEAVRAVVA